MALYKNSSFIQLSNDPAFDKFHEPGVDAPHPGIYRCKGCASEIAIANGNKLPPQNHHQHTTAQGKILWQLVVSHA